MASVLLYIDTDEFAGTECHVESLALSLRCQDISASIACPSMSALARRAADRGLNVFHIGRSSLANTSPIRELVSLLKSGEIDLIHAHNGRTALAAAAAVRFAGRGQCIATQHFLEPHRTGRRGLAALASRLAHRWVKRHTAHQIAVSNAARNGILMRNEGTPDGVTVVPNGIPIPDYSELAKPADLRAQLNIPADAILIVCASRLEPEKDVNTLIEAMPHMPASPPVRLIIAGAGSQEQALLDKVNHWGLNDCVTLLGFRGDVLSLINASDLFVLPSKVESFGLVLLEAMSLSKPVVATAAGGPLEIVIQNETGLLVQPNNPTALAAALRELALDSSRRMKMGQKGLQRFRDRFTADQMARETAAVYRKVLGVKGQSTEATSTMDTAVN